MESFSTMVYWIYIFFEDKLWGDYSDLAAWQCPDLLWTKPFQYFSNSCHVCSIFLFKLYHFLHIDKIFFTKLIKEKGRHEKTSKV